MLPIVRLGCTSPSRSYLRSVCGCMPSIRAATLMKKRSRRPCDAMRGELLGRAKLRRSSIGIDTSRVNVWTSYTGRHGVPPSWIAIDVGTDLVTIGLLVVLEGC